MSFPRYAKYKDSGVDWLGEVPEHWRTAPLKSAATYNDDVLDERAARGDGLQGRRERARHHQRARAMDAEARSGENEHFSGTS